MNTAAPAYSTQESAKCWKRPTFFLAGFAVWALWLSSPYYILGANSFVRIYDNADGMFSVLVGYSRGFARPTLWASAWGSGVDWLSQGFANNLYVIPFLLLSPWAAYALVMFVQRFVAGYFCYRLLKQLGVEEIACLYAGLTYSLFVQYSNPGFNLSQGLGEPAFPLVLLIVTRKTDSRWRLYTAAVATGILYALSSGFALAVFVLALLLIWLWIFRNETQRANWIAAGLFFLGWVVAASPSIAAPALNAAVSHRAQWSSASLIRGGLPAALQESARTLRFNLISLILIVVSLAVRKARTRRVALLFTAALACTAAPVFWYTADMKLRAVLGFLVSGFNWSRFDVLVPVLAVSAAAIAGSALLRSNPASRTFKYLIAAAVAFRHRTVGTVERLDVSTCSLKGTITESCTPTLICWH